MQMRVKMQQPADKCVKIQMRTLFVNGPIPDVNADVQNLMEAQETFKGL